ncbi:MAG TPA: glycosyltransferase [Tepidisphaeraceae bacterium]|jgi:glycosyltransferase involved in cell wall biosynthesis|nr:glycosyltransferase [Tepidisphaeraceae bacterium]
MSDPPAVSVVMPLYNTERHLAAAIDSVLAQTFADFEIIAVDDGSTDGTLDILRRYESRDRRVRVLSRPNTGIVGALNDGLAMARAELIARMDGDDICLPGRFRKQVDYLAAHPECVLVGSQVLLIDPEGSPICAHLQTRYTHEEIDHDHLNRGWPMVHPAVMMRREAVDRVGRYREKYKWLEDHDLFLRLAEIGKLANLPDTLLRYRLHFQSVCHTRHDVQGPLKLALYQETQQRRGGAAPPAELPAASSKSPSEVHRLWAWWALKAGNVSTARKHAIKTVARAPFSAESWRIVACAARGH